MDIAEHLKKIFDVYAKNWLSLIVGLIAAFIIPVILAAVAGGALALGIAGSVNFNTLMTMKSLSDISTLLGAVNWGTLGIYMILALIFLIAAGITGVAFFTGYYRYCGDLYQGRKTSISAVFQTAKEKWLTALVATIIVAIIIGIINIIVGALGLSSVGMLSTINMTDVSALATLSALGIVSWLISFIVGLFFIFVLPSIAVEDRGIVDSIQRSVNVTASKFVKVFLTFFVLQILLLILTLIPIIGSLLVLLVYLPLSVLLPISILKEK
jgi:hypothetical protein